MAKGEQMPAIVAAPVPASPQLAAAATGGSSALVLPLPLPLPSNAPTSAVEAPDVPAQVFEKFLADAAAAGLPAEMITRLRATLIDERAFSDRALRAAVLAEEPLP